ncbi:MAG: hypothetical protein ACI31E_01795 [Muribaculaceae bacterium]
METTLMSIASIITAFGGIECIKYLYTRQSHKRASEIAAAHDEFNLAKESVLFLQEEMSKNLKEIKRLQDCVLQLTREKGALECELMLKRCERRGCPNREPQNGY